MGYPDNYTIIKFTTTYMKVHSIIDFEDVIKVLPEDTLSSALGKLKSAHDAAFVFDKDNKYLGLINPYSSVIKTSLPSNAKVLSCLFHAPRIGIHFSISKIAQLMNDSKVHYLPVFNDQEKFLGRISARSLLRNLHYLDIFSTQILQFIKTKKQKLVTVNEDDSISNALHIFKTTKVSKLVVVNKEFRLKGIISYYDLISFLASPKKKDRSTGDGNKHNIQNKRVRNFAKSYVLTLGPERTLRDALHLILEKKIGSVVVIDPQNRPITIITTKDLLSLFIRESNRELIEVTSKNLSHKSRRILGRFFYHFKNIIQKGRGVSKAKLYVKEEKQGGLFQVILSLFPKKGEPKIIKKEGKNLENVLKEVKRKERS